MKGQLIRQKETESNGSKKINGKVIMINKKKSSIVLNIMKIDLNFNQKSPIIVLTIWPTQSHIVDGGLV